MAQIPRSEALGATRPPAIALSRAGRVRLGTLNNLRWLGIAGQGAALLVVYFVLGYDFGLVPCAVLIGASAILNVALAIAYPAAKRLTTREATAYLAFDVLQLAALLYLTGGIENPFSLLFLAPVVISAASLEFADTVLLATLSFVAVSVLANYHWPLPWPKGETFHVPLLYRIGIWVSLILGIGFTSIYARRIARETARMSAALSATQLALAREHRLASLGALAAAAAHELGTPLATIAVVTRELERDLPKDSPYGDDFRLLREQADRCRAILTRLARPEEAVTGTPERMKLGALLDDLAAPHRGLDVTITIAPADGAQPLVWRAPALIHGLGNLIENAADFAAHEVRICAKWDGSRLAISVEDDGPGFAAEILENIGEPYVTSRPGWRASVDAGETGIGKEEGMGLGFFIAKTLIEQTGGTVNAENRPEGGARVTASWPRGAIDGENPPTQALWI